MSDQLNALFTYVSDQVADPAIYNYRPDPDDPDRSPVNEVHQMPVTDARRHRNGLSLDREGLEIVNISSGTDNYYDDGEIRRTYYPEVARLVQQSTGASRVHIFDYNLRCQRYAEAKQHGAQRPVRFVHNDYTVTSGPQRVRDLMGDAAERLLQKRFAVINVWKPIVGPVRRSPLAVCDASTMDSDDFVKTTLLYRDRQGEIYTVKHRPQHRWFYVSQMRADEAMLLKCYDSATDGRARFTAHSAFEYPITAVDAPDRESIEVRTLAFFG